MRSTRPSDSRYALRAGRFGVGALVLIALAVARAQSLDATAVAACDRLQALAGEDPEARRALAMCFLRGVGRFKDHALALDLLADAAADGSRDARFALAVARLFEVKQAGRFGEAVRTLEALAGADYAAAHFPLAMAYAGGSGVVAEPGRVVEHLAAAALAGDDVAAFSLAVAHRYALLGLEPAPAAAYRYVERYQAILAERHPGLVLSAQKFREAALALHHDRLLRAYLFSDAELELFPALADEIISHADLAHLRKDWAASVR